MDTVMEASDMKKSTIKTYLINLKESVERRERVLRETAGHRLLDIELVEAVDGRKMSAEEVTSRFPHIKVYLPVRADSQTGRNRLHVKS